MSSSDRSKFYLFWCRLAAGCGIVIAVVGIVVLCVMPTIIHNQIATMIPLVQDNSSMTYKGWMDPPADVYMQFWLFHLRNPEEVSNLGRPVVDQLGPFTYTEKREKVDVVFHPNNTVSYRQIRRFFFVPELSQSSDKETLLTTVNLPMVVVSNLVKKYPGFVKWIADIALKYFDKGLFVQHTIYDMIWGYKDPALSKISAAASIFGIKITPYVGLFYGKNNSDDGLYTINTGQRNLPEFMRVTHWNHMENLPFWTTKEANMINGTDGTMFSPFVDRKTRLYLFSSDICRSIYAEYDSPSNVMGIDTLRFLPPSEVFANSEDNPANKGFCTPTCLGSGVLNLTACQPGVPVIMSQPHFYQADERYIQAVEGMHPSSELSTTLDIEPSTGILLKAGKKLQININLEPVPGFPDMALIKPVFYPLIWINESAILQSSMAAQLKNQLFLPVQIADISSYTAIVAGIALIVIGISLLLLSYYKQQNKNTSERMLILNNEEAPATNGQAGFYNSSCSTEPEAPTPAGNTAVIG